MTDETYHNVQAEIARARQKFPGNRFLFTALVEEVGELAQSVLQQLPAADIYNEAKQVACVAIRIMEETDSIYREMTELEALP